MKRFLALALLFTLFIAAAPGRTETAPEALYTVRTRVASIVYEQWDGTEGVNPIGTIPKKRRVSVLALNPTFALVSFDEDKLQGYVRRVCLEDPRIVNNAVTPPYGVDFNHFLAVVEAENAPVTTAPGGGETLITLHSGARVSFISFENGYGKLIYHRQYGYVDSRLLGEAAAVYESPENAGTDAPIASFTSF